MFYRENGQFNTSYRADQQIFPVRQDRIAVFVLLALAFIAVPLLASEYLLRAVGIPFLILSLAALGLNLLVGYCGQVSLGSGGFMAVGAYTAYNVFVRLPGVPLVVALLLGGLGPRRWGCCLACRRCASRACTWPWPRWRRSSSSTGRSCASPGSRTGPPPVP
jgi:branched-chain amino acid transport system permease protein